MFNCSTKEVCLIIYTWIELEYRKKRGEISKVLKLNYRLSRSEDFDDIRSSEVEEYSEKCLARAVIEDWDILREDKDKIVILFAPKTQEEIKLVQKAVEMMNDELLSSVLLLDKYHLPTSIELPSKFAHDYPLETPNITSIEGDIKERSLNQKEPVLLTQECNAGEIGNIDYILNNTQNREGKILVMGDVMLDHIMKCDTVPYLQCTTHDVKEDYTFFTDDKKNREQKRLGGAANIAYCCSIFSEVILYGVVGNDGECKDLMLTLEKEKKIRSCNVTIEDYLTISKIYLNCYENGVFTKKVRMNRELNEVEGKETIHPCIKQLRNHFKTVFTDDVNCIIFKDHQKGFLSEEFLKEIAPFINSRLHADENFLVIVDPKYDWKKFSVINKIHAIIPNLKEASAGIFPPSKSYNKDERESVINSRVNNGELSLGDWSYLAEKYPNVQNFVVKADKNGATLFNPERNILVKMPATHEAGPGEIGCGDVFDAYFVNCLIHNQKLSKKLGKSKYQVYLRLANIAAGIKLNKAISEKITSEHIRQDLRIFET